MTNRIVGGWGLNSCGLDATIPFSTVARRWQRLAFLARRTPRDLPKSSTIAFVEPARRRYSRATALKARVFARQFFDPARRCDRAAASSRPMRALGSLVRNAVWIQRRPHAADSMPAAQLMRNRREDRPRSSRVADESKNGNLGRKLNHKEQIAKLRTARPKGSGGTQYTGKRLFLIQLGNSHIRSLYVHVSQFS